MEGYVRNEHGRDVAPIEVRKAAILYPLAPPPPRGYTLAREFTPELLEYFDKTQGGQAIAEPAAAAPPVADDPGDIVK